MLPHFCLHKLMLMLVPWQQHLHPRPFVAMSQTNGSRSSTAKRCLLCLEALLSWLPDSKFSPSTRSKPSYFYNSSDLREEGGLWLPGKLQADIPSLEKDPSLDERASVSCFDISTVFKD